MRATLLLTPLISLSLVTALVVPRLDVEYHRGEKMCQAMCGTVNTQCEVGYVSHRYPFERVTDLLEHLG